ncbi:MAG: TetR/AcrR family transcriptional regulator [Gammaproteobacteria bacterium]|nr:MAG: TetR/AcrR family transcriptional regulator [Gammaproteobacteria bacterium]
MTDHPAGRDASTSYHHGNLRQALLETGRAHLEAVGPDKISLRALAREIGVSQTAPYRHFRDKMALLAALAAEGFRTLQAETEQAVARAASHEDRMVEGGLAYIHFAQSQPALYKLMFGPVMAEVEQHEELRVAGEAAFNVILRMVRQAIDEGAYAPADPLIAAQTAWALVHGLASLAIDRQLGRHTSAEALDQRLRAAIRLALAGFSAG